MRKEKKIMDCEHMKSVIVWKVESLQKTKTILSKKMKGLSLYKKRHAPMINLKYLWKKIKK